MKKLSYWARRHPVKSQIIIGLLHLLLIFTGFYMGMLLFILDVEIPYFVVLSLGLLFMVFYYFYPIKGHQKGLFRYSYQRRKRHDFTLTLSYALMIAVATNHFAFGPTQILKQNLPKATFIVNKYNKNKKKGERKAWRLQIKNTIQDIRMQLKAYKQKNKKVGTSDGQAIVKFLLFLLGLAAAIGLAYLIGRLACNIACSGNEGLAWLVLILGLGGILFLLFVLIRALAKKSSSADTSG